MPRSICTKTLTHICSYFQRSGLWSGVSEGTQGAEVWLAVSRRHIRPHESAGATRQPQQCVRCRALRGPAPRPNYRPEQVRPVISVTLYPQVLPENLDQMVKVQVMKATSTKINEDDCLLGCYGRVAR